MENTIEKDGITYSEDMTKLIKCPQDLAGAFAIPESVMAIAPGAFSGCEKLTSINIPCWVSKIGSQAFSGCINLKNIIFEAESHLKTIEIEAFLGCQSLTSIELPESLYTIEDGAFAGCAQLKTARVPRRCRTNIFAFDKDVTKVTRY